MHRMAEPTVVRRTPLVPSGTWPRIAAAVLVDTDGLLLGEWSMTACAFTDCHQHVEVNTVLEGELVVTVDAATRTVLGPGDTITVPAGSVGRYEAPVYARMTYAYGPGERGMGDHSYEEL